MKYKLKDLVTIKYGKNQKLVEDSINGKFPILGTGGIIGYAKESLYNKPSVLIGRKGTIDKIRYVDYPFWTIDTLFYTEINTDLVYSITNSAIARAGVAYAGNSAKKESWANLVYETNSMIWFNASVDYTF